MIPKGDASKIKLLVLDADGTLSDGGIFVGHDGAESIRFHVRDGFGIRAWLKSGRELAVITGRGGASLRHRLNDLGVRNLVSASGPKGPVIERILTEYGIQPEAAAAMGDDLPDLPLLQRVGYPMAVSDAVKEIKDAAVWVSSTPGGHGAVREAVEHLLRAAGAWQKVVESIE